MSVNIFEQWEESVHSIAQTYFQWGEDNCTEEQFATFFDTLSFEHQVSALSIGYTSLTASKQIDRNRIVGYKNFFYHHSLKTGLSNFVNSSHGKTLESAMKNNLDEDQFYIWKQGKGNIIHHLFENLKKADEYITQELFEEHLASFPENYRDGLHDLGYDSFVFVNNLEEEDKCHFHCHLWVHWRGLQLLTLQRLGYDFESMMKDSLSPLEFKYWLGMDEKNKKTLDKQRANWAESKFLPCKNIDYDAE